MVLSQMRFCKPLTLCLSLQNGKSAPFERAPLPVYFFLDKIFQLIYIEINRFL